MKKVDEAERHNIDTGRAPVEVLVKQEVDVGLFELNRASELVICVVGDAAVLELNLGVEDDVIGDLKRRQQHNALGIKPVLPSPRRLVTAEFQFAISADAQNSVTAIAKTKKWLR